jgi:hypothetical protein
MVTTMMHLQVLMLFLQDLAALRLMCWQVDTETGHIGSMRPHTAC